MSRWIATAALLLALAVCAGAFGAHGLRGKLEPYALSVFEKAVFYHFIHALGIFAVAMLPALALIPGTTATRLCGLLLFGILIFSGSLYALALTGIKWLGAITPIGGVSFIVAWMWLAIALWRREFQ